MIMKHTYQLTNPINLIFLHTLFVSINPVGHLFAATMCLVHAKLSFMRFLISVVLESSKCDKFDIWYFCSALEDTSVDTEPKLNYLPGMRETMIAQMHFLLTPVADHDQASTVQSSAVHFWSKFQFASNRSSSRRVTDCMTVGLQTINLRFRLGICAGLHAQNKKTGRVHLSWSGQISNSYANGLHYSSFSMASKPSNVWYHSEMRSQQIDCLRFIGTQNISQS